MPRSVLGRLLHDRRRAMFWWCLCVGLMLTLQLAVYPSMKGQGGYQEIWDKMPETFKAMFGVESGLDMTTPAGYLNAESMSMMIPLILAAFAIGLGGGSVAGDEERGTLDLVMAHPVRRRRVVLDTAAGAAVLTLVLAVVVFAVIMLGRFAFQLAVPVPRVLAAMGGVIALALLFGAIALAAGCGRGRKGFAYALGAGAVVVAYLLDSMGKAIDVVRPFRPLSPFRWALGDAPLRTGFHPLMLLPLVFAAALVWVAVVAFERRDLT
jgi:ABC-2 type transport system permease protein